ncbi:hypothetical protein DL96DRAFT_1819696 [Flagelloscypha sp. PMI_526]|nr:hypothetical protein DL96DRAFT_1819696 [Flagelloscypha sp. PMI_526]
MSPKNEEYIQLRETEEFDEPLNIRPRGALPQAQGFVLCGIILIQAIGLVFFGWRLSMNSPIQLECPPAFERLPLIYSPVQDALEYEVKVFTLMNGTNDPPYRGVSDKTDEAWRNLYDGTFIRISKSEAARLPNRTYPIADEAGYYIAQFDVFHQLHCLNTIRKTLNPERYVGDMGLEEEHIRHCIDSIRQSLMCTSDVSAIVWQWNEQVQLVQGRTDMAHSCRNFEKLQKWTHERRLSKNIDFKLKLDDELPDIPLIS